MKGEEIYLEMSDPRRRLNHIYDCLEFAHSEITVGLEGEINSDYTVTEVNQIQNDACVHLEKAMDCITHLIGAHSELQDVID